MAAYVEILKKRRSIYALGKNTELNETQITDLVKEAVKESPTAFNSQTARVVILFDQANDHLWKIVAEALRPLTPADSFANTQQKLASFNAGKGTVLFFEDHEVVKNLQNQFSLYADNFPVWSEQATGIVQHSVWTALAEKNIGASLQHYNPVIDEQVAREWDIPSSWVLRAQMPFGSIETPAGEKEYIADEGRFKVFR